MSRALKIRLMLPFGEEKNIFLFVHACQAKVFKCFAKFGLAHELLPISEVNITRKFDPKTWQENLKYGT